MLAAPDTADRCMPLPAPPALRCFALVPCAGTGTRAGAPVPKQYVEIDGAPMVAHTLGALAGVARIKLILVALAPGDEEFERRVDLPSGKRFKVARCGGASRAETVAAGLAQLVKLGARVDDWVLVHDAARCLVRAEWIDRLIDVCADDPVGGLLAMPVADTLKREAAGRVMATLPRDAVWQGADAADVPPRPARRRARQRPARTRPTRRARSNGRGCRRGWCRGRRRTSRSPNPRISPSPKRCSARAGRSSHEAAWSHLADR
jgi:2-C-methyl-D-erythritol 4-phosphate cytidylyltransferase